MYKKIKETILYYIVNWWYYSWIFQNMVLPIQYMKEDIERSVCKEDADFLINRKCYRFISKKYKEKLLNEKFN